MLDLDKDSRDIPNPKAAGLDGGGGIYAHFPYPVFQVVPMSGEIVALNSQAVNLATLVAKENPSWPFCLISPLADAVLAFPGEAATVKVALAVPQDAENPTTSDSSGPSHEAMLIPTRDSAASFGDNPSKLAVTVIIRALGLNDTVRTALSQSRSLYKDLTNLASDFAWETDDTGAFSFVSPQGILGFRPEEMLGRDPSEFVVSRGGTSLRLPFHARKPTRHVEMWIHGKDGRDRCVLISAIPLTDIVGNRVGARGVGLEITKERTQQAALAEAKNREDLIGHIIASAQGEGTPGPMTAAIARAFIRVSGGDGVVIAMKKDREDKASSGTDAVKSYWSVIANEYSPEVSIPPTLSIQKFLEGMEEGTQLVEGELNQKPCLAVHTKYAGDINGAILIMGRVPDAPWHSDAPLLLRTAILPIGLALRQVRDQSALLNLAQTDELTGLLNRRAFMETLSIAVMRATEGSRHGALLYIDLDNFKPINDVKGHEAGDRALGEVANILTHNKRSGDIAGRLGGDEFALWLDGIPMDAVERRTEELLIALSSLRNLSASPDKPFGASIGIAPYHPSDITNMQELVNRADAAMYRAKAKGKNQLAIEYPQEPEQDDTSAT